LRAFRAIEGHSGANARAWVLTIVRHTAYTWLSKNRSRVTVPLDDVTERETDGLTDRYDISVNATPEAELIAKIDADRLENAIAQLPLPFREAFVLREVQGLTYGEIASVTGVPLGTVMSRLARARQRLINDLFLDA